MSQTTPVPLWRPEDQRSWEELERRAAAQLKDFSLRAPSAVEAPSPAPPPAPPLPEEPPPAPPPPPSPPPERLETAPLPPRAQASGAVTENFTPGRRFLGRFSGDQLLLAALLFLLIQEEAEPQLILAVAYILFS